MEHDPRTPEQIREHYEIEKRLAQRLLDSTRQERQTLYTDLYDELFRSVPHHPLLTMKTSSDKTDRKIEYEMGHLQPFMKPDTVFLEVGPGDCALSYEVSKSVKAVYAIDVSEELTKDKSHPANFKLTLSDGTSIPLPANSVDVAYSNQLMEHLHPSDALDQLRNIYAALASGGTYICITPNRLNGPHDISKHFDAVATGFHLKEYTVTELDRLFKTTGFRIVKAMFSFKGKRYFLPAFPVKFGEKILGALPHAIRNKVASSRLATKFLGISLIGIK